VRTDHACPPQEAVTVAVEAVAPDSASTIEARADFSPQLTVEGTLLSAVCAMTCTDNGSYNNLAVAMSPCSSPTQEAQEPYTAVASAPDPTSSSK
jgi:hypothetical protein